MSTLDRKFGIPIDPIANIRGVSVHPWEYAHRPVSWTKLSAHTAAKLRSFMVEMRKNFLPTSILIREVIIIWIIDEIGELWFSIEEIFHNNARTGLPKFQKFKPTAELSKLGHPSLLNTDLKRGRIAGEIFFDGGSLNSTWVINNKSGRYGIHSSRNRRQLRNVADMFRNFGMDMTEEFI